MQNQLADDVGAFKLCALLSSGHSLLMFRVCVCVCASLNCAYLKILTACVRHLRNGLSETERMRIQQIVCNTRKKKNGMASIAIVTFKVMAKWNTCRSHYYYVFTCRWLVAVIGHTHYLCGCVDLTANIIRKSIKTRMRERWRAWAGGVGNWDRKSFIKRDDPMNRHSDAVNNQRLLPPLQLIEMWYDRGGSNFWF